MRPHDEPVLVIGTLGARPAMLWCGLCALAAMAAALAIVTFLSA